MFHHSFCNYYYEATVLSTIMIFFFWCHGRDLMWSYLELRREKLAVANMERKCDWSWCNVHPGVPMSKSRELRGGHCLWTIMHLVKVCLSLASKSMSRKPCAIGLEKLFQNYSIKVSALSTLGKSLASKALLVVQSLSCVRPLASPWTAAWQAPLSVTVSWSLLRFMSIESVMVSNHHILLPTSPFAFNLCQHQGLFQWIGSSHQMAKVLELQL